MFNRSGFNRLPFNRVYSADIRFYFTLDLSNELSFSGNMEFAPSFEDDIQLAMDFDANRDKLAAFAMELSQELEFEGTRDRVYPFEIDIDLQMSFDAARFHVDEMIISGDFAPGDKIIIDSDALKLTKNGTNALHLMQGDFFDVNPGTNEVTYTDDKTGRDVRIRMTHRDRFV